MLINNCHIQIRKRCRKVERLRSDLKQSLDEHSMATLTSGNDPTERWVANISDKPLSDLDKTALSYGFNFAITPTKLPIAEILSSVESGIKHLPPASANLIRAKTVSILKGSKPSRQSNIKKDQLETLKALSKDPSVTILPADKGRAVVVMDSSDYQQKIYGLLQDENTYTKISDQRKNPTSSTEKSLNALLKQIKDQKSIHDPGAQQLDDELCCGLRGADAAPAAFCGLPGMHGPGVPLGPVAGSVGCPACRASV